MVTNVCDLPEQTFSVCFKSTRARAFVAHQSVLNGIKHEFIKHEG